ncbi:Uncharacterised protein [Aedoeadaptatus ivorii]|uniref:N-acetyltransferase domain-containing protein n=1 Tax=Aedoeadaptatus ivorii TaxID=54006 RepID=A0A448V2K6_9FIRM|nr:GNAT family N-acetyltransferase [Peptoniphilus ivorii]VEJ36070.1 Uncharacterised protein [Peptoniphilus ivorii]
MTIYVKTVPYGTHAYGEAAELRDHILYRPRGLRLDAARKSLDRDRTLYGLYNEEALIGIAVTEADADALCIHEVLIQENHRREGLGTALLSTIERLEAPGTRITASAPLSLRPFFEAAGYLPENKHRSEDDLLQIEFSKVVAKNTRGAAPFYDPRQEKPLLYITTKTRGFSLLPVLRNRFPKEHLFVLDLPEVDAMWFSVAERAGVEATKYAMLAPELAGDRRFYGIRDLDLPKAAARAADRTSRNKRVLLLGTEEELKGRAYEAAFEAQNPSLSSVQMLLPTEGICPDESPDAAFYETLTVHAEALQEEEFDAVVIVDSLLSTRADAIRTFLARKLERTLFAVDVFDLMAEALRLDLIANNRIRHAGDVGELRIFTETPDRARKELRRYHPAERSAPIETLR